MGKIIVQEMVTLDGFFAGPNREIDWHNVDAEFNEYAADMLETAETLVFGRVTYELMAAYWPQPAALQDDPRVTRRMNALPKIVFSRTLQRLSWANAALAKEGPAGELKRLRAQPGKNVFIFGSGSLVSEGARLGLIDEFRFLIAPVVLGRGATLFGGIEGRLALKLIKSRTFLSGNVLLCYEPAKAAAGGK